MVGVAVQPAVLEWARRRGGVTPSAIRKKFRDWDEWLSGEKQPSIKRLEDLAAPLWCALFGSASGGGVAYP